MALIKCEECGIDINDKAELCPNCGCPIKLKDNDVTGESKSKSLAFIYLFIIIAIIVTIFFLANREEPPYTGSMVGTFVNKDLGSIILKRDGTCEKDHYSSIPLFISNCTYVREEDKIIFNWFANGEYIKGVEYSILPNGNLSNGLSEYYRQ